MSLLPQPNHPAIKTTGRAVAKRNRKQLTVRAEWKAGPPNAAWDELWRRIFAGPLRGFSVADSHSDER